MITLDLLVSRVVCLLIFLEFMDNTFNQFKTLNLLQFIYFSASEMIDEALSCNLIWKNEVGLDHKFFLV
jgi:hypothetical protein